MNDAVRRWLMSSIGSDRFSLVLRVLMDAARARLAELETAYTIDKARMDSLQASLFQRLRTWCQERDRLRLVVSSRQQFLEVLLRQGEEEAEQAEREFRQAKTRSEQEYEETAQTLAARRELTAAINYAKDRGDLDTLRQIAGDPHGFILRQGWAVSTSAMRSRSCGCRSSGRVWNWRFSACWRPSTDCGRVPSSSLTN